MLKLIRFFGALCCLGVILGLRVKAGSDNRVVLKCNDTLSVSTEKSPHGLCEKRSSRCVFAGYTIGPRDEIYHTQSGIACLIFHKSIVRVS